MSRCSLTSPANHKRRPDHHGQRHPDDAPLRLDADLVGLHLPEIPGLLDQMLLHGLALVASPRPPTPRPSARQTQKPRRWLAGDSRGRGA